jgi:hypothetical protein
MRNVILWAAGVPLTGSVSKNLCYDTRGYGVAEAAVALAATVSRVC